MRCAASNGVKTLTMVRQGRVMWRAGSISLRAGPRHFARAVAGLDFTVVANRVVATVVRKNDVRGKSGLYGRAAR